MRRIKLKTKVITVLVFIMLSFYIFVYIFDRIVMPTVMVVSDAEMRAKSLEIINKNIFEIYSKDYSYEDFIKIEKDNEGNILMIRADTIKLGAIASKVALKSQQDLKELGDVGISMPLGYVFKNNILSYLGPSIKVKMQPIGYVETRYSSEFESAGINQTRHKIYIMVRTEVRVIIPLENHTIEVKNEIPISETILIGKIPNNVIDLDFSNLKNSIPN